jgi:hypothetical protein
MAISSLLDDYQGAKRTPSGVVDTLLARGDDGAYASAWIYRVDAQSLQCRAKALEDQMRMAADGKAGKA